MTAHRKESPRPDRGAVGPRFGRGEGSKLLGTGPACMFRPESATHRRAPRARRGAPGERTSLRGRPRARARAEQPLPTSGSTLRSSPTIAPTSAFSPTSRLNRPAFSRSPRRTGCVMRARPPGRSDWRPRSAPALRDAGAGRRRARRRTRPLGGQGRYLLTRSVSRCRSSPRRAGSTVLPGRRRRRSRARRADRPTTSRAARSRPDRGAARPRGRRTAGSAPPP